MYIEPNGICHILKGVPLDNTYEHTLWFDLDNQRSQYNYFITKKKYTLTGLSYTRYKEGVIVVEKTADQLYDCNYLMFQNTAYGNKWFYAFITSVEYVNNVTSYIYFMIDVLQTWHFDYTPKQCFIEREHSVTDVIGENLVVETIEKGDYIVTSSTEKIYRAWQFESVITLNTLLLFATQKPNYNKVVGLTDEEKLLVDDVQQYFAAGGIDTIVTKCGCPITTELCIIDGLKAHNILPLIIEAYSLCGQSSAIIGILAYAGDTSALNNVAPYTNDYNVAKRVLSNRTDGTPPKNNKLYTNPYVGLVATNGNSCIELCYEYFSDPLSPKFSATEIFGFNGKVMWFPKDYSGKPIDYDLGLTLPLTMKLAWVNDYFQNYCALNEFSTITRSVTNGLNIAAHGMGLAGGIMKRNFSTISTHAVGINNTVNDIMNTVAERRNAKIMPDQMGGTIDALDSAMCSNISGVRTYCKSIRPEFVDIVDDYFTRFGYATHKTKYPNRNSRPHFNYVKTIQATITGSVPADDMRVICSIYDNGITFWKNGDEVGNYDVDNRP